MANKMLIDATHREETRVVVCKGSRVEEFDLELEDKRQLRGNIYLAKVTRVEPSLQAAFVDYGGNRHGFLAFAEIHPDYYQIPYSDRQALLKEAAEDAAAAERNEDAPEADRASSPQAKKAKKAAKQTSPESEEDESAESAAPGEDEADAGETEAEDESSDAADVASEDSEGEAGTDGEENATEEAPARGRGRRPRRRRRAVAEKAADPAVREDPEESGDTPGDDIASVGAEDALEELPDRLVAHRRQYKIQEVIRRRQILLVQVVKEERGTKGAALTTYLSIAGRYCVLMPNTARGGGISRKITSPNDRRRLKSIAGDLKVPEGTGVIVRTAGANRTKAEIKRDYEYLQRLWESIRGLTLKSTAPSLIYEEGSLIKRSIRDLYNKEIDEVLVEGEDGYQEAKAFMRMLMPSHARHVKQYKEDQPLFVRHRVESQLDQMFSPVVTLKSGGYLVINQTEALVAIDVNSGKATREHNVEDTALQTNLEAAAEVARQLRLRDLAGLIVIDFIDMEERRNNRAVERKIKDCLKTDRARIQVGRISHFGLLEMSRQRIRASVIEGTMEACRHCEGSGRVRSVSSTALQILRSLEEMVAEGKRHHLTVTSGSEIALYMLNRKRAHIGEIEKRYGIEITIAVDEGQLGSSYTIERGDAADQPLLRAGDAAVQIDTAFDTAEAEDAQESTSEAAQEADEESGQPLRRKRRRRGRRRGDDTPATEASEPAEAAASADAEAEGTGDHGEGEADGEGDTGRSRSRRRRGRRGGRRQRRDEPVSAEAADEQPFDEQPADEQPADQQPDTGDEPAPVMEIAGESGEVPAPAPPLDTPEETDMAETAAEPVDAAPELSGNGSAAAEVKPQPAISWPWQRRSAAAAVDDGAGDQAPMMESGNGAHDEAPLETASQASTDDADEPSAAEEVAPDDAVGTEPARDPGPQRRGWWQRRAADPH